MHQAFVLYLVKLFNFWNSYLPIDYNFPLYLWHNDLPEPEVLDRHSSCESHQNMTQFLKKGRSLFVVVPTAPLQNYKNFTREVLTYNKKEPFNFETPSIFINHSFETYVSIYAAYLYDSVKLYANALHKLLAEQPVLTEKVIEEVASNGTRIIETIIESKTYKSMARVCGGLI